MTIGTLLQTSRLFGGEIGTAFMQTFVRVREQVHSNLIGLHVDSLGGQTADRLAAYRNAVGAHSSDAALARRTGDEPAWVRRREAGRGSLLHRRISRRRHRRLCVSVLHRLLEAAGLGVDSKRGAMRTAYCFTPDRAFFAPAVRAIASMVEAEPDVEREIFLICEPDDVAARLRQAAGAPCANASSS